MSWRNDIRRHKEVTAFIELFQKHNKELILAYGNVLAEVTNARYLLIEKDTDGSLTVRMLGSSDRDKIAKELERQRAKTSD
jgi:hypothetical protein